MLKKTVLLVAVVLSAVIIYTTVWPYFNRPPQCIEAPEHCKAILEYANRQMAMKFLNLPSDVSAYEINEVIIHKMEEIPGPHNRMKATATLNGYYTVPPQGKLETPTPGKFQHQACV